MNIKEILSQIDNNVLSEEFKVEITKAFDGAVNEALEAKVKDRVQLEIQNALTQLDEQHSTQLKELLESIDQDHSVKMQRVVEKLDKDYAKKLKALINRYDTVLKEEAVQFRNQMVGEISDYMELCLDRLVPVDQIKAAASNTSAKKLLENIKKVISVDEEFITNNIREALQDGKNKMDSLRDELTEAVKTNIKLNQDLKTARAELILEKKTFDFPKEKREFVMKVLGDKSPDFIEEHFQYAVDMFEQDSQKQVDLISEGANKETTVVSKAVDTPKSTLTESAIQTDEPDSPVNEYVSVLKSQDK